jgi:hypothetical protein
MNHLEKLKNHLKKKPDIESYHPIQIFIPQDTIDVLTNKTNIAAIGSCSLNNRVNINNWIAGLLRTIFTFVDTNLDKNESFF